MTLFYVGLEISGLTPSLNNYSLVYILKWKVSNIILFLEIVFPSLDDREATTGYHLIYSTLVSNPKVTYIYIYIYSMADLAHIYML